jgi:RNA polymerase sigma factor (sigma-70 family)
MHKNSEPIVEPTLESLVDLAKAGNKNSLEALVRRIQDRIYGLSLRMLYRPEDAEDATQEILIKIITHLDSFEGRSRFSTWAYRIASNHLLNTHKRIAETFNFTFGSHERMVEQIASHGGSVDLNEVEMVLMIEEMKRTCTQGLLLCLRRKIRLAFILGEIFGATSTEGAEILGITQDSFRQRLSRGRKQIREFMIKNCSMINPSNTCQCKEMAIYHIKSRLIDPENPCFVSHPSHGPQKTAAKSRFQELDELGRVTALFRSHPEYAAPDAFVGIVKQLVDSRRFELFNNH